MEQVSVKSHPHLTLASVTLLGLVIGLAAGVLEAAVLFVRRVVLHKIFPVTYDSYVWTVPTADAVIGLLVGWLLFGLVIKAIPASSRASVPGGTATSGPPIRDRLVAGGITLVALLGPLFAFQGIDKRASVLLAAGAGLRLATPLAALAIGRPRRLGMVAAGLAVVIAAVTGAVAGSTALAERRAQVSTRPTAGTPNLLFLTLDTVRKTSLSLYGNPRRTTPAIDRLGTGGVVFDQAWSPSPWTLPAHAAFFTGRYPHEHRADWLTPLDGTYPTVAEILRNRGFRTGGFVANTLYCSRLHGLNRGFVHFEDFSASVGQVIMSSSIGRMIATNNGLRRRIHYHRVLNRKTAEDLTSDVLGWIGRDQHRPFFVWVNYFDAHEPYVPPPPFDTLFGPARANDAFVHTANDAFRASKPRMTPVEAQAEVDAYEGAIAYIDQQVDRLLDGLRQRGMLENTIVVIVADHGEQLGEHGFYGHGNTLYRPLLNVPFLVWHPGQVPAGIRVASPVPLVDLAATLIDLTGADQSAGIPGASLSRFWQGTEPPTVAEPIVAEATRNVVIGAQRYPLTKGDMRSLVGDGYYYIHNGDGSEELYDFPDSGDTRNLAESEAGRAQIARMRQVLDQTIETGVRARSRATPPPPVSQREPAPGGHP